MPGTYTISTEPVQDRTYTNKHNKNLVVWRFGLEGAESTAPDKLFDLHKLAGNTPKLGDVLEVERHFEGTDNEGTSFTRLYVASNQSGGYSGGGKSSGGGGGARQSDGPGLAWKSAPFERGAEHPRNEVRMIHTSALSAAVPFINQLLAFGVTEAPKDEEAYWALVGRVAARLRDSYQGPLSRVGGAQGAPQQAQMNGGEVPADTAGLAPAPAGVSDDVPF